MNSLTLALSGLEQDDVATFRRIFGKLRANLSADWRLVDDDADATLTVIDVDTIYGHMNWLRAVGAGLRTLVFTSAQHSRDSDLVLIKPLVAESLAAVLNGLSAELGQLAPARAAAEADTPREIAPDAAARSARTVVADATRGRRSSAATPALRATPLPPAQPDAARSGAEAAARAAGSARAEPAAVAEPARAAQPVARPAPAALSLEGIDSAPKPAPRAQPAPATVGDLLRRNGLAMPVRIHLGDEEWVIDPERDAYHGPSTLKPLQAALARPLDALAPANAAALERARKIPAQPLARLRWFAGLLASPGRLDAEIDATSRVMLSRWPQIEREFPRHFRIATAMMKQPGTLAEIAAASGVAAAEVADFINAAKTIGILSVIAEGGPEEDPPPRGGVMSRLRNSFGR